MGLIADMGQDSSLRDNKDNTVSKCRMVLHFPTNFKKCPLNSILTLWKQSLDQVESSSGMRCF